MSSKAELRKLSDAVATIKSITRVYEQAAARKMRVVRMEMEKIVEYLDAARGTYSNVKHSISQAEKERVKQAILGSSFRRPTKNEVLVLIASQSQFYGQLIPNLFGQFIAWYRKTGSDSIILGHTGRELLAKEGIKSTNITYFDFDDSVPDWNVIHKVSEIIGGYAKIVVFYGEYKTVLTQEAKSADISQMVMVRDVDEVKKYLFRPQAGHTLSFLEKQMIAGGFLQKIYEAQVAKYAARIKILEIGQVAEKISEAIGDLSRTRRRVRKSINNKKQQQLFTGSELWQEEGMIA